MDLLILVGLAWVAMLLSFVAGCAWNSDAYERGYERGHRDGFNRALGKDTPR